MADKEDFLPECGPLDSFHAAALKKVSLATKSSNGLPSEKKEDFDYYSSFSGFRTVMDSCTGRIEAMMSAICRQNGIKTAGHQMSGKSCQEMLDFLQDFNDQMLEKTNLNLDEAAGIRYQDAKLLVEVSQSGLARISGSWNKGSDGRPSEVKLLAAKHVARPQLKFKDFINNSSACFVPRLTDKPHNKKPLSILIEYADDGTEFYSHPYLFELDHFTVPDWQLNPAKIPKVTENELVFVDTKKGLQEMIEALQNQKEIGVDVEHHSYRSYLGITCLIQISTETKDYIVDPFPIWADMTLLNQVFANPKCVKVLHGCGAGDVKWLQRDFSLYFVNVFDSYVAAKTLGFPRGCLSLSFLLSKYCGVHLDKKFQLADWRIRPLSQEMLDYARCDTKYLIQLSRLMKRELVDKSNENLNLLRSVYDASNDLCKFRYEKPFHHPETSYLDSLVRSRANLNSRQAFAYRQMFNWRDKTARQEDESLSYVLPQHMLLKICSELPREMQGILACCNPVPPLVKQNLNQLHDIILKARDQPMVAVPAHQSVESNSASFQGENTVENSLKCPLDLSHFGEMQDGLESLLNGKLTSKTLTVKAKKTPSIEVFLKNQKQFEIRSFKGQFLESISKIQAAASVLGIDEPRRRQPVRHGANSVH